MNQKNNQANKPLNNQLKQPAADSEEELIEGPINKADQLLWLCIISKKTNCNRWERQLMQLGYHIIIYIMHKFINKVKQIMIDAVN